MCHQLNKSKSCQELRAGVARVDITDYNAGPVNGPLFARALVVSDGTTQVAVISLDVVAVEEIGPLSKDFLPTVKSALEELGFRRGNFLINASHCHGLVAGDVAQRTVQAVEEARDNLAPVTVWVAKGHEDRIMENRRLRLRDGREADVRHAYSLPPDEEVIGVGPVDPEIGILQFKRQGGETLAVVFNFACHPIQGVPEGGNSSDISGFACQVIEESLGDGAVALFLQGCAGDINPVWYKDVDHPRDAEPLGQMLGCSVLQALQRARPVEEPRLKTVRKVFNLPRADLAPFIAALEREQAQLLASLKGTSLNLKTYLALMTKHRLSPQFPAYYSHRYLHERTLGRCWLERLDAENRNHLQAYTENIFIMEELTRLRENLRLLQMHHAQNLAAGKDIEVEVLGLRIGEFILITFPGELSVQIGLDIKALSPYEFTFVAGYTNGYIYYAPTREQLRNRGHAQEDSDCLLSPEWQTIFEQKVGEILAEL